MNVIEDEITECELTIPKKLVNEGNEKEEGEEDGDDDIQGYFELYNPIEVQLDENDDELDFPENVEDLQSGYLVIKDPRNPNKRMKISKSAFVWHLTEGTKKISSDRLIRVKDTASEKIDQQKEMQNSIRDPTSASNNKANVSRIIKVRDWCIFRNATSDSLESSICFGLVLAFKFAGNNNFIRVFSHVTD